MKNSSIHLMIIGGAVWAVLSAIIIMRLITPSEDAVTRMTDSESYATAE